MFFLIQRNVLYEKDIFADQLMADRIVEQQQIDNPVVEDIKDDQKRNWAMWLEAESSLVGDFDRRKNSDVVASMVRLGSDCGLLYS